MTRRMLFDAALTWCLYALRAELQRNPKVERTSQKKPYSWKLQAKNRKKQPKEAVFLIAESQKEEAQQLDMKAKSLIYQHFGFLKDYLHVRDTDRQHVTTIWKWTINVHKVNKSWRSSKIIHSKAKSGTYSFQGQKLKPKAEAVFIGFQPRLQDSPDDSNCLK